ncbi:methionine/alanine import family NSS transporter small subunit [Serinibacter salmoneus]|uniref:Putative methionine/alanine importer small subunit n=1 Tax=Serinibacter salmoneus TaxID=556530 RepID=A0A2A9D316_9MICO|nr:methionine/alanine import family NSS transporter small subunit [Serinibacter salmoneus]PFG21053.1 putative methionine/alanine importer small subunit [Serinibacter salmoneus]
MTPEAVLLLVVAILVVWGGLVASIVALRTNPERAQYPPGGVDDDEAP